MKELKIGCPTYIFRNACNSDLFGVMANIAEIGYDGIELLGLFGHDPAAIRKHADAIDLKIMCDHIPYHEFVRNAEQIIEDHVILGTPYISIDRISDQYMPGGADFAQAVAHIEEIGHLCSQAGMKLLYHNHGYDLIKKVQGKHRLEVFLDSISSETLSFLPDLGWIALGGGDPDYFLDKYADRCPIIHLKDYYSTQPILLGNPIELNDKRGGEEYHNFEFRPTGYGIMNYAKMIRKILDCDPEWIVADHDVAYERDGMDDQKAGYEYIRNLVEYAG